MLLKYLLIAAAIYLLWRWINKSEKPRLSHDPKSAVADRPPWEILGIDPNASQDELRAAYQSLISQYHPDKVADMGPELRAVAEKHTKEINAAYSSLRKKG